MSWWRDLQQNNPVEDHPQSRGPSLKISESSTKAVESVYAELHNDPVVQEASEEFRTMSEVQRRLHKANFYRAILENGIFDSEASEEAIEVETEMREFAMKRLRVLMGIDTEEKAVKSIFTKEEEFALKILAGNVLSKPGVLDDFKNSAQPQKPAPPPQPVVKTIKTGPTPSEPLMKAVPSVLPPVKRRPGRPVGTGKHQKAAAAAAQAQPEQSPVTTVTETPSPQPQAQFIEKEIVKPDGTVGTVKINVAGQVRPVGIQPAPPVVRNASSLAASDLAEADRVNQVAMTHPVMQSLMRLKE